MLPIARCPHRAIQSKQKLDGAAAAAEHEKYGLISHVMSSRSASTERDPCGAAATVKVGKNEPNVRHAVHHVLAPRANGARGRGKEVFAAISANIRPDRNVWEQMDGSMRGNAITSHV